ncbi:MAG: DUF2027 domain-containing protein [Chitinophagales bacterium]|nr:DUF2027 domain-containing protein [Chitinophagales bacterium]
MSLFKHINFAEKEVVLKNKFSIGDKVFLIHSKEEATITKLEGSSMLYVQVDGMEIPVFYDDISRDIPLESKDLKVPVQATVKNSDNRVLLNKKNSGVFICFFPLKENIGDLRAFDIYLLNDTEHALSFSYNFFLGGNLHFTLSKIALPNQPVLMHQIEYDLLNDMPFIDLTFRDVMNKFINGVVRQKIKPQNFFNKLNKAPLLEGEMYLYKAAISQIERKKEIIKKEEVEDIFFDPEILKQLMSTSAESKDHEISPAVSEVDLHIEELVHDHALMPNSDKIQVQLRTFEQTLERAIANHANKLYIIHGVGSGKLKNEIHRLLKTYREVKSFNNDYHPKYGYGATEIFLR